MVTMMFWYGGSRARRQAGLMWITATRLLRRYHAGVW
jgi:hypothetical protein